MRGNSNPVIVGRLKDAMIGTKPSLITRKPHVSDSWPSEKISRSPCEKVATPKNDVWIWCALGLARLL